MRKQIAAANWKMNGSFAANEAWLSEFNARKSGLRGQDEPTEVRNLSHDAEARAQAEAAMQQMMAKSGGRRPGR